jgi:hypothetical protein
MTRATSEERRRRIRSLRLPEGLRISAFRIAPALGLRARGGHPEPQADLQKE